MLDSTSTRVKASSNGLAPCLQHRRPRPTTVNRHPPRLPPLSTRSWRSSSSSWESGRSRRAGSTPSDRRRLHFDANDALSNTGPRRPWPLLSRVCSRASEVSTSCRRAHGQPRSRLPAHPTGITTGSASTSSVSPATRNLAMTLFRQQRASMVRATAIAAPTHSATHPFEFELAELTFGFQDRSRRSKPPRRLLTAKDESWKNFVALSYRNQNFVKSWIER